MPRPIEHDLGPELTRAAGQWALYHGAARRKKDLGPQIEAATKRILDNRDRKLLVSWSGGKDSQVVLHLARMAGVEDAFAISNHLEFPAVDDFFNDYLQPHQIIRLPFDLNWLAANPALLWADKSTLVFMRRHKWAVQSQVAKKWKKGGIIFGRRTGDSKKRAADGVTSTGGGNFCGHDGQYETQDGLLKINPIHDWSTEDVYAYMHKYGLGLYPPYKFGPGGLGIMTTTTEGWFQWVMKAEATPPENAWRILKHWCDPEVLKIASKRYPLAKRVLLED